MLGDLTFWDPRLEALFAAHLRNHAAPAAIHFAAFRSLLLLAVVGRSLMSGQWGLDEGLFLFGAASNAAPALLATSVAARLPSALHGALQWAALLADVAQAAIGARNHAKMAPFHEQFGAVAACVYLPFGCTALWLVCYTSFSCLAFHWELLKAALVTTVLLANSQQLCSTSPGLRLGYGQLHDWMGAAAQRLLPGGSSIRGGDDASGVGLPAGPLPAWWRWWQAACPSADAREPTLQLCMQYQTAVLLVTFLGVTWAAHRTQRRMRLQFLGRMVAGGGGSPVEDRLTSDLRAEARAELTGPLPNSSLDFLCLAVPAALCVHFVLAMAW